MTAPRHIRPTSLGEQLPALIALLISLTILMGSPSKAEQAAYAEEPWLKPVFMGTAVHRATAQELRDQFAYRTVGPDFLEGETGNLVELTTPGQVAAHVSRGGDYADALYATYRFGHQIAE